MKNKLILLMIVSASLTIIPFWLAPVQVASAELWLIHVLMEDMETNTVFLPIPSKRLLYRS